MLKLPTVHLAGIFQINRRIFLGLACAIFLSFQVGCCPTGKCVKAIDEKRLESCQDVNDAFVAYYYNYKADQPDNSDILYIENVPLGARCIVRSDKVAPVFPGHNIDDQVKNKKMKIDKPKENVLVQGLVGVAVYYDKSAIVVDGKVPDPAPKPLAVEDLTEVSRQIKAYAVLTDGGACTPGCPQVPCDGYQCCKRPCP
jgi:hypothetical protein